MKYLQSFGRYVFLNFTPPYLQSPRFILKYKYANKATYRTKHVHINLPHGLRQVYVWSRDILQNAPTPPINLPQTMRQAFLYLFCSINGFIGKFIP